MNKDKRYLDIRLPHIRLPLPDLAALRRWLPTRGSVLFTVFAVVALLGLNRAGALSLAAPVTGPQASTNTIAYQGRIANAGGTPLTGTYSMVFRLYNIAAGGAPLWEETWTGANGVKVSDGLFNVMLGSLTPIPTSIVSANPSLWLGITVGTDSEMSPRVQLGSVPFSMQALTVPDGSITNAMLGSGAVDGRTLADGAVTQQKIGDTRLWRGLSSGAVVQTGVAWMSVDDTNIVIPFDQPFGSAPLVLITQNEASHGFAMLVAHHISTTGFQVQKHLATGCYVNWIAIGDVGQ